MPSIAWYLELVVLIAVVAPVVAVVAGVRAGRRSRSVGLSSTAWASGALVLVRCFIGYLLVAGIGVTVFGGSNASTSVGNDVVTKEHGVMTVPAIATSANALCPVHMVQNVDGPDATQGPCRASHAIDRAQPPNAKLTGYQLDVRVERPSAAENRRFTLIQIGALLAFAIGLVAVERILHRTAQREPFAIGNVRWLRVLALAIVGGGWLAVSQANHLADDLIRRYGVPGPHIQPIVRPDSTSPTSLAPVVIAILILVLAEIWRFGIRLQDDVEATV